MIVGSQEFLYNKSYLKMESFRTYLNRDEKPLIIFDGGTGTSFQNLNLTADDFGGKELEGCNENLVLSSPEVVEKVHNSFLEAGCHVIETNTSVSYTHLTLPTKRIV